MIRAECPGCGKTLKIDSRYVGKRIRCADCGTAMRVPSESSRPSSQTEAASEAIETRCPACTAEYRLAPKYVDRLVRCKHCGDQFRVSGSAAAAASVAGAASIADLVTRSASKPKYDDDDDLFDVDVPDIRSTQRTAGAAAYSNTSFEQPDSQISPARAILTILGMLLFIVFTIVLMVGQLYFWLRPDTQERQEVPIAQKNDLVTDPGPSLALGDEPPAPPALALTEPEPASALKTEPSPAPENAPQPSPNPGFVFSPPEIPASSVPISTPGGVETNTSNAEPAKATARSLPLTGIPRFQLGTGGPRNRIQYSATGELNADILIKALVEKQEDLSFDALVSMGAAAEDAVLARLAVPGDSFEAKSRLCDVLAEVGTAKSIAPLQKLSRGPDRLLRGPAAHALMAVSGRK